MACPIVIDGDKTISIIRTGMIQNVLGCLFIARTAMSQTLLFLTAWQYWRLLTMLSLESSSLHIVYRLWHKSGLRDRVVPDFHYGSSTLSADKAMPPHTVSCNSIPMPPFHSHQYCPAGGYIPAGHVPAPDHND